MKVGIRAPREMPVIAREVKLVRDENVAAAARSEAALAHLMAHFRAPVHVSAVRTEKGK